VKGISIPANKDNWVLGMFAKWPAPGLVKSRLAVDTSPDWAAAVARAFLLDLLERFASVPVRRVLAFSPPEAATPFSELVQGRFALVPQAHGDLGERLAHFVCDQLDAGAERVVLIGTDSPTLPRAFVEDAFAHLDRAEVVIGPATDGGYYLIGCRRFVPELFQGIAWGTEHVLRETVTRVRELGLRLAVLPPWYDVDTLADWEMLRGHLAALQHSGVLAEVPHTERIAFEN
jgi:rSAM/selenodomain-associated transferase 1